MLDDCRVHVPELLVQLGEDAATKSLHLVVCKLPTYIIPGTCCMHGVLPCMQLSSAACMQGQITSGSTSSRQQRVIRTCPHKPQAASPHPAQQ
jgi:hypothetical protein